MGSSFGGTGLAKLNRDVCCDGDVHKIEWDDTLPIGSWCFLVNDVQEGACEPECVDASGRFIALDCPEGFFADCQGGCMLHEPGTKECVFNGSDDLLEWIVEEGGFVHPHLEISTGPDTNSSIRGVFASGD